MNAEQFCKAFLERFPVHPETDLVGESTTWIRVIDGAPTSGECDIDGLPIVDYYDGREPLYLFSVLKVVSNWADKQGWHAELCDPGTVKFYKD